MKIVILTGAGISAESGVKTFRDNGGLWEGHRIEDVATMEAFESNPKLVHEFYNLRRRQLAEVSPNAAHVALAELEQHFGDDLLLIAQNVDDLHERAGSTRPLHMHGELLIKRCYWCADVQPCDHDLSSDDRCESCGAARGMRPHIVWFGEMPLEMDRIEQALIQADVFVAIGTSALVYPAAMFFSAASAHGAKTIEVNLAGTARSAEFDECLVGPATEKVPELVTRLIRGN